MRELLWGWRRKAAILTLILACSVTFIWFRSFFVLQVLNIPIAADEYFQVCSTSRNVSFSRMSITRTGEHARSQVKLWYSGNIEQQHGLSRNLVHLQIGKMSCYSWQAPSKMLDGVPFKMSVGTTGAMYQAEGTCRAIPHWSIVLPLTLISASLLLSKPSSQKEKAHQNDESLCAEHSWLFP
ncbi:hypothetical protein [Schlesneria sp. DSM 10557]|uniref:hypothetical protein n=1 Tax=Schlesneria sp. DSM 10557 TaxID=3044399 RepID=UPI00359FC491